MNSPTYVHQLNAESKKRYKVLQILFSLALSLFIIFSAVKLTLMFKQLYYFDIEYLNIAEQSNYSKDEIIKNYDYVIDYLLSPKSQEFQLPSIAYSKFGQIHFKDVKRIFTAIDFLLIATGLISLGGLIRNIKKKDFAFLKLTPTMLILPEEFFMHSALVIVFIILFSIVTLAILNRKFNKKSH
jgi:uncharacterized membrane protein